MRTLRPQIHDQSQGFERPLRNTPRGPERHPRRPELTIQVRGVFAAMGGAALLGELVTRELLVAGALILSGIAMTLKR